MSSSVHIDNKGKGVLILDKSPIQGLDDTTLTAETKHSVNFSRSHRKFCLSLHYDGRNSFLSMLQKYINIIKKKSEIKPNLLCLGNISKDFSFSSTKKNRIKCLRVQCLIIGRLILIILPIFISI